jgi:hypothetical protein
VAQGKYYLLTEDDRQLLLDLKRERDKRVTTPRYEEVPSHAELFPLAPQTYVALTPSGGIPALTEVAGGEGSIPGHAVCDVYRVDHDYAEKESDRPVLTRLDDEDRIVYNVLPTAIGGNRWVPIKRMAHHGWLAESLGENQSADNTNTTGTGTAWMDPPELTPWFPDTGTGTNPHTGGPGGPGGPGSTGPCAGCSAITFEESDLRCEPGSSTLTTMGGGGLNGSSPGTSYLNLYKRLVIITQDARTCCLVKTTSDWYYVRTIGCCEPNCVEPDTGTSPPGNVACCPNGSLYEKLGYTLSGPTLAFCGSCLLSGYVYQVLPPDGLVWTNSAGGSTCGGRAFLTLTLYCAGGGSGNLTGLSGWRASGSLRRYVPGVYDVTQTFDVSLSYLSESTLNGSIPGEAGCADMSLSVTNPCYHYECVDGVCQEMPGEADPTDPDQYKTVELCEVGCTGGGVVPAGCFPCDVNQTLHGTITAKTGGWTALPDNITLVWDGFDWVIQEEPFNGAASCGVMSCFGGTPYVSGDAQAGWTCSPFMAVFLLDSDGGIGGTCTDFGLGAGSCTLTVTD